VKFFSAPFPHTHTRVTCQFVCVSGWVKRRCDTLALCERNHHHYHAEKDTKEEEREKKRRKAESDENDRKTAPWMVFRLELHGSRRRFPRYFAGVYYNNKNDDKTNHFCDFFYYY
jgi:hypothetical protein